MDLSADDYFNGVKRLEKASAWKSKTQQYVLNRLSNINRLKNEVDSDTYKPDPTLDFTINENGHIRLVKSLTPRDSVLQHTLSDAVLVPEVTKHVIYDTGSGLKHRGLSFTRKRFEIHLKDFMKKYKHGYALMIDFSKYFDNIDHEKFINIITTIFDSDEKLVKIIESICKQYEIDVSYTDKEDIITQLFNSLEYIKIDKSKFDGSRMMRKSLGIGAPVAQIAGLIYPYIIDNYIKTVLGMKYYDVYMDDRILLWTNKSVLKDILDDITKLSAKLGIFINPRKTKIVLLWHEFTWLKTKYKITPSGKVIKIFSNEIVMREKRKLRKFNKMIKEGTMKKEDAINQYKSWRNSRIGYNDYYRIKALDEYAERMIGYGSTNESKSNSSTESSTKNNKFGNDVIIEHFRNWRLQNY